MWALPAVAYGIWRMVAYATPLDAVRGEDWGGIAIFGCLLWSVVTSYRGAKAAFVLRPWPARLWFLILPVTACVAIAGLAIGVMVWQGMQPPDVLRTRPLRAATFTVAYPGNWRVNTEHEDYDPDSYVVIEPELTDAAVSLHFGTRGKDWDSIDDAVTAYRELPGFVAREWLDAETWGPHRGQGASAVGEIASAGEYVVRVFATESKERILVVREICAHGDAERMAPGFALIRITFAWR